MTKKKRKPSAASLAAIPLAFDDGSVVSLPMIEAEFLALHEAARLAVSDDPDLRTMGEKRLRIAAELITGAKLARLGGRKGGTPVRKADADVSDRTLQPSRRGKKGT